MAAVCTSTAFLLVLMALMAYNGFQYPRDHVSCETFMSVYVVYDRYGLEHVKDATYHACFPCCQCPTFCACTCCPEDTKKVNGVDWRVQRAVQNVNKKDVDFAENKEGLA